MFYLYPITLYSLSYLPLTHKVIIPKAVLGSLLVCHA